MGWGIEFTADIYLSRQNYNENLYLVKDKLDDIQDNLNIIKSKLKMFGSSNVKDLIPEEWKSEPIDWINNQIEDLLSYYDELMFDKHQLDLYYEYLNSKNDSKDTNNDQDTDDEEEIIDFT